MRAKGIYIQLAALLAYLVASLAAAYAQTIEEKAQLCSACHGENGVPPAQQFPVPVIWGQNLGYLFFQLRDFKSGARKNDQMTPIAQSLEQSDLMPLAQYFSKKPWPNLQQPRPSADVLTRAQRANNSVVCTSCHQEGIQGRGHTAASCRAAPRVPGKDDARFPQRRPRQQSRHVGPDEGDHRGGHRGPRRVSRGAVSRPEAGMRQGRCVAWVARRSLRSGYEFLASKLRQTRTPLLGMAAERMGRWHASVVMARQGVAFAPESEHAAGILKCPLSANGRSCHQRNCWGLARRPLGTMNVRKRSCSTLCPVLLGVMILR